MILFIFIAARQRKSGVSHLTWPVSQQLITVVFLKLWHQDYSCLIARSQCCRETTISLQEPGKQLNQFVKIKAMIISKDTAIWIWTGFLGLEVCLRVRSPINHCYALLCEVTQVPTQSGCSSLLWEAKPRCSLSNPSCSSSKMPETQEVLR